MSVRKNKTKQGRICLVFGVLDVFSPDYPEVPFPHLWDHVLDSGTDGDLQSSPEVL